MDLKMPVMGGIEATRIIKQISIDIPIIAQTANNLYATRDSCMEAGCNDFITKPTDSAELLQMISCFLKQVVKISL
jgi:CheY-like chemotaxis protein